jgi:hypothetical protein
MIILAQATSTLAAPTSPVATAAVNGTAPDSVDRINRWYVKCTVVSKATCTSMFDT